MDGAADGDDAPIGASRLTFPQGVRKPEPAVDDSYRFTLTAKGQAALIWCREPLPDDDGPEAA